MNIVKRILKANRSRDAKRLALKYKAMRAGPFSFFRGTCHLFYDRLTENGFETDAPLAWACGDLHLENFGSYKGDNRLVYFDLNDFDEAALAPTTWELVRLLTSVHVGLEEQGMSHAEATSLVERLISSYAAALVVGKAAWIERDTASGVVRKLLDKLRERKRADFLAKRTRLSRRHRRLLVDGVRMLPIDDTERALVNGFMKEFAKIQANPDFYRVLDVARRIAGTGSLGVTRYAILVEGHGSPDGNYLFDLKQSGPSSLANRFPRLQPRWKSEAERITTLQSRMQAVTTAFLQPVMLEGRPFVLRALQPAEDRLPFGRLSEHVDRSECVMEVMARCLAWAQLRSAGRQGAANADALIAFAGKNRWRREIAQTAATMAHQVTLDWENYCLAFDAGQFEIEAQAEPIS
jgi:uncharacterized protein (DUF2252 family)